MGAKTPGFRAGQGRARLGHCQTHSDPVPVPGPERADNTSFLCSWLLVGRERTREGPQAYILPTGFREAPGPVFKRWGREGGGSVWAAPRPGHSVQRLEEMPAQLPAWAGSRCVGSWHWKRPGHFPDKAGAGVPFQKRLLQSSRSPSPKGGAQGGTHTCLSYARNVAPQAEGGGGGGGGASWGWRLGKGPRARKTLQALGRN